MGHGCSVSAQMSHLSCPLGTPKKARSSCHCLLLWLLLSGHLLFQLQIIGLCSVMYKVSVSWLRSLTEQDIGYDLSQSKRMNRPTMMQAGS